MNNFIFITLLIAYTIITIRLSFNIVKYYYNLNKRYINYIIIFGISIIIYISAPILICIAIADIITDKILNK